LFIVRHEHNAENCPAKDPAMGAMLLNHLSRPNVARSGLKIHGEGVVRGEHIMFFIAEAADEATVAAFVEPFRQAGSVEVMPASTCAGVVASGGCAAPPPSIGDTPVLDPEAACQDAIDAGLVVHRAHPLNGETSVPQLLGGVIMPHARFYVRNHFQIPNLDAAHYKLQVTGCVERPLRISYRELCQMPSQTTLATLECAGNGRVRFDPPIPGERWNIGAVSTAEWTGVPLVDILDRAGIAPGAHEVLFRGADGGVVDGEAAPVRFERSLRIEEARNSDVLLAYLMNGEPLPIHHGFPVRVIVPSWYAVASVKWLTEIELIDRVFAGHHQTDKYWYEFERNGQSIREPVTLMQVRALITEPAPDTEIEGGDVTIRGVAWSGVAPIARVQVSAGGGWQEARLIGAPSRQAWQRWELVTRLDGPGRVTLAARATDRAGRIQPDCAEWNRHGYGNNSVQKIAIQVI
jgi:DMSO/TMAO reductase YedYZ molybdopterin-dependent catalytic subunit